MLYPADINRELDRALYTLKKVVLEGLEHGNFEFALRCKTNGKMRELSIVAGKSHKFSIPPEELIR